MKKISVFTIIALSISLMTSCSRAQAEGGNNDNMQGTEIAEGETKEKLPFEIKDNMLFNENIPLVVDFYADWCGPCKAYAPTFHAVAEKMDGAACFVSLNADEYPELCKTYGINSIPATLFIMPGGGVLGKEVGVLPEEKLTELVNQLVETSNGVGLTL